MSARNPNPIEIIFDTNTNLEPIHLCVGNRFYRIEDEKSLHYLLSEYNGKGQLHIRSSESLPLIRVYKKKKL